MALCLTFEELFELSGYKKPSCIRKWLGTNGIPYYLGADGYPRVLRDVLSTSHGVPRTSRREPNFSALEVIRDKSTNRSSVR